MKYIKSITAVALSLLLVGSAAIPAFAQADSSEKEEVVYIMTDAGGKVTDIEAVNIFSGGKITDYGEYSSVKMLNTTDKIEQKGDKITFSSDAQRVYYQGTMNSKSIPWNISIRYFLDGKEYSADKIAGKNGKLEIRFSVKKAKSNTDFYDNYALQAAFTLDTDKCKNIEAEGATTANVGSDKQLSYTILPGKGIDTVIRADVTDFEMSAVTINGVRLNLNVDIDDDKLMEKVDELISSIGKINDGASDVNSGTKSIMGATNKLNGKVGELYDGVGALTGGSSSIYSGLEAITSKNSQLTDGAYTAYEGLCSAASAALNSKLNEKGIDSVSLTPSNYSAVLNELLKKLDADEIYNRAYQTALQKVTEQVEAKSDELYDGYIRSQANTIYREYVTTQADTLYAQVAAQAVYEQLIQGGYNDDQANAYLKSAEGQALVSQTVSKMTDEQKSQILDAAVLNLTDEQKEQILKGAVASLTDEQKKQIKNSYIQQMMSSDEVTSQLNAATASAGDAAKQVSELKGQLDSYGVFYRGLVDYTKAVSDVAVGAKAFNTNMNKLNKNVGTLKVSVGKLNDAVKKLYGGTNELANGTAEFVDKTSDMDSQIEDEIDSMTSSISGGDDETVSFVSEKNTNVKSVQFVIKTAAVEKVEAEENDDSNEAPLTFWQKLLRLFGLY